VHIEGSYSLQGSPETVYALLMNPAVLADCLPGCQQLVAAADGTYNMKMKVALAALSGDFIGKVAMEDLVPPASYRLRVEGAGRIGFLNGQGELRLSSVDAGSTLVTYQGEVHTGGTIAAVGQRLVDSTARMMIRRFFERLDTILQVAS
jgi:uncharacterized protein